MKLKLRPTQIKRLLLVFDEKVTGHITLTEFQHTLEAYELSGELHTISKNGAKTPYVTYETVALERFITLLRNHQTTTSELFNSCDTDDSGTISLGELRDTILQLNPDMLIKE